jgi:oxygen-independent coproporphyrinogen-3 oxidase
VEDVIEKFHMAREIGFNFINMDMIIGLPGEGPEEVKRTVGELQRLSPENITVHTMAVKRASRLNEEGYSEKGSRINEMYAIASRGVREMGMYPYYMYRQKNMVSPLENIGYCRDSYECIYNIQMIAENISIIALGADAVSKAVFPEENRIERFANLKDVKEYIGRIGETVENKLKMIDMIDES